MFNHILLCLNLILLNKNDIKLNDLVIAALKFKPHAVVYNESQ